MTPANVTPANHVIDKSKWNEQSLRPFYSWIYWLDQYYSMGLLNIKCNRYILRHRIHTSIYNIVGGLPLTTSWICHWLSIEVCPSACIVVQMCIILKELVQYSHPCWSSWWWTCWQNFTLQRIDFTRVKSWMNSFDDCLESCRNGHFCWVARGNPALICT